jgi:glutathione S-transferase
MSIKIYGMPKSQNVRKPLAVAHQLGIPVESVPLMPMDPKVRELNPAGRIPILEDGDFRLAESNAILLYLASKSRNELYPDDASQRAQIHQWLFWDSAHWTGAYQPIQFERLVKRLIGLGEPDEAIVSAHLEKFAREAAYLDASLVGRAFLLGAKPTLADFAIGCGLTHAEAIDLPYKNYANIRAWNGRLKELDGFKKTAF